MNDDMKQTKALRRMLEDMAAVYNDGESIEVQFTTGTPYAAEDGSHVAVCPNVQETYGKDVEGANELRIISDTLNHEMEHIRSSVLTAKKEFSQEYPQCPTLAGLVLNVLEDQYIDWQRLKRFRGLRGAHSFKVDTIMANGHRRPPIDGLSASQALGEGFLQIAFAGYVKGFSDAPQEVKEALVKCRPLVDSVRNEHDQDEREEIAHSVMGILLDAMPDPDEAEDYADDAQDQAPTDEPADLSDEEIQDLLDEVNPEDLEDADGEAETIEVPDSVDVPEWMEDEMETAEAEAGEAEGSEGQQPEDQEMDDEAAEGGSSDGEQEDGDEQDGEAGDGEADPQGEQEDQPAQEGGDETPGSSQETGEDTSSDGIEGDGERNEDSTAGGADMPEDLEDEIREMEKKERQRNAGDHWDAGDLDYEAPDDEFQRRHDTIQKEVRQEDTEMGQQKQRRDERMADGRDRHEMGVRDSPEQIREKLRDSGLAEEIIEAFEQFKTSDRWLPDSRGEKLHTRNAVRRLAGDYTEDRVYERKLKAEVGDRCVVAATDLSGSMADWDGNLTEVKMALGALHLATKTIGDDFGAIGFKTYGNHPQKGECDPVLDLVKAPSENWDWDYLDGAREGHYTPTPDGVMYALRLLQQSHRREKVMIVITDGKANVPLGGSSSTSGRKGREDTLKAVNTARQEGVKVIGLAVGGGVGDDYMDEVFGTNDWAHADMDNLTEKLVEIYRDQMRTDPNPR